VNEPVFESLLFLTKQVHFGFDDVKRGRYPGIAGALGPTPVERAHFGLTLRVGTVELAAHLAQIALEPLEWVYVDLFGACFGVLFGDYDRTLVAILTNYVSRNVNSSE
jgi:hypothetical protein